MTQYGEGRDLGQSISNDAVLITEQATADVYTPNNIRPSSKQSTDSVGAIVAGAEEQLTCTVIQNMERGPSHMFVF